MGRLFPFQDLALRLGRGRRKRFVRGVEVPVIQGNPESHGVVGAVEVPRIHVDADGAVLRRILARGCGRRDAVVKRDLARVGIEFDLYPRGVPPFLVFTLQVLVEFARRAKGCQSICLCQPYIAVAIRKSDHQFPSSSCAEIKRLEFDGRFIRKIGFGQAAAERQ